VRSSAAARSYAKALFSLAKERGQTDAIARELDQARMLLAGAPPLGAILARPWVTTGTKRALAAEVATRAGLSPLARDFLALVVAQGRLEYLDAMATEYRDLVDADLGRVRARVRTAIALTADQQRALAARLAREVGGKTVLVDEEVDPTLLGGFVAEVGSVVLDGSLDGQLARLREKLATG
jgi:F-type H+-transporting ATPase subunit delta